MVEEKKGELKLAGRQLEMFYLGPLPWRKWVHGRSAACLVAKYGELSEAPRWE